MVVVGLLRNVDYCNIALAERLHRQIAWCYDEI